MNNYANGGRICSLCGKKLNNAMDYEKHKFRHGFIRCIACGAEIKQFAAWQRHRELEGHGVGEWIWNDGLRK